MINDSLTALTFSSAGYFVAWTVVAYVVFVIPISGMRRYGKRTDESGSGPDLWSSSWRFLRGWTILLAAVALAVAISPRVELRQLGVALPSGRYRVEASCLAVAMALAIGWAAIRARRSSGNGNSSTYRRKIAWMLPRTAGQRLLATAVAITAAVSEEFVYRGLMVGLGIGVLPGSPYFVGILSLTAFAAGHAYQGSRGVVASFMNGAAALMLYLVSGSLLLPIAFHLVADLSAFLIVPAPKSGNQPWDVETVT